MENPTVSVIIPTFNREHLIGESIDSVLAQDFDGFEVIVVDDGSTDNTAEVLARYGDRIRVLRQANAGCGTARTTGIQAARAPLIALHDSDDKMLPGRLATQVTFMEAHPEVAVLAGNIVSEEHKEPTYLQRCGVEFGGREWVIYERPFEKMLAGNFGADAASVIRRECFLEVGGYDLTLRRSADWDLWLRMARRWPFACVNRACTWVRKHEGNIRTPTAEVACDIRIIHKALGYGEPIDPTIRKRVLQGLYRLLKAYLVLEAEGKIPAHSRIEVMRYVSPLPWHRRAAIGIVAAMPRGLLVFGLRQGRRLKRLFRGTGRPQA